MLIDPFFPLPSFVLLWYWCHSFYLYICYKPHTALLVFLFQFLFKLFKYFFKILKIYPVSYHFQFSLFLCVDPYFHLVSFSFCLKDFCEPFLQWSSTLPVMYSFNFSMSEKVFISPLFGKDNLLLTAFILPNFKVLFHCLLAYIFSKKKFALILSFVTVPFFFNSLLLRFSHCHWFIVTLL